MISVGITGGIGSGKSTVCKVFEAINIPIYYADDRAKHLMRYDIKLSLAIRELLSDDAYLVNGELNREFISSQVFQNKELLTELNQIVHPAVFQDSIDWLGEHKDYPYTVKEAALLVETGSYKMLDKLIVVTAPIEVRIERVIKRDNADRAAIQARMDNQLPEEEKVALADFVIANDGSLSLIDQVLKVHHELMALAEAKKKA